MELHDLRLLHVKFIESKLSSDFMIRDGIIYFKNKYYIGSSSTLKSDLLHEFHNSLAAGHAESKCTLVRLASLF